VRIDTGTIMDVLETDRSGQNVDHICLVVTDDIDALASSGRFEVVDGPDVRWGARGDARAVYVRDPDGNMIELRNYS
jgi:catechol 2,3-dioxygenase-like lactoylglutathione lyase family enzyme